MTPATITTEAGHTWCRCPSCRQKLGEITDDEVVIAKGPVVMIASHHHDFDLICWRCHKRITVRAQEASAA